MGHFDFTYVCVAGELDGMASGYILLRKRRWRLQHIGLNGQDVMSASVVSINMQKMIRMRNDTNMG